jgi:tRNA-Thr(GGU) m(6)t(6)A37 methyltransferase TsaA
MVEVRELILQPIGRVVEGVSWGASRGSWKEEVAEIELDPAWREALDGIESFSHIWVVWWPDRFEHPPNSMRVRPEGRSEMPLVGILATRSPHRPNPIAITAVRLLERQEGRLRVQGLDAFEGTPIFDIKPYLQRGDRIPETTVPDWLERLWSIHDKEQKVTADR